MPNRDHPARIAAIPSGGRTPSATATAEPLGLFPEIAVPVTGESTQRPGGRVQQKWAVIACGVTCRSSPRPVKPTRRVGFTVVASYLLRIPRFRTSTARS